MKLISVAVLLLGSSLLIISALLSCGEERNKENRHDTVEPEIETGTPAAAGMDSVMLSNMTKAIVQGDYPNIHSVLITKNNKLVYENYFPGHDEILGTSLRVIHHHHDSLHDIRSVTKSVVSACVGIAVSQNKIRDVEQSVWDFFPEYAKFKDGEKARLTIKNLLTMSSGLEWNENIPYTDPANSEVQMDESPDPIGFVLARKSLDQPGTKWNYNGGTTQLLAAIIKKVTGSEVDEYARQHLFEPLGIKRYVWLKFSDSGETSNIPLAAAGLRLRSRDMLKFGMLYMNDGMWNGKRILPKGWVPESHRSHVTREDPISGTGGYGYQFWIENDTVNNKALNLAFAVGNGDQRIFFDRTNDLLVVITAGNYNQWTIKNNAGALMKNFIYPAIMQLR